MSQRDVLFPVATPPSRKVMGVFLSLFLILTTLMIPHFTPRAEAVAKDDNDFTVNTTTGGVIVTGLTDQGKSDSQGDHSVIIPSTIGGQAVKGIGNQAFRDAGLTSVILPDTPITIGYGAFQGNGLSDVVINATSIGSNAFAQNKLKKVTLKSTTDIHDDAFRDNVVTDVTWSNSIATIGARAFLNNQLNSVDLSSASALKTIGDEAFAVNKIQNAKIPDGVGAFGKDVFAKNGMWVKVETSSSAVKTTNYDSGYGHVINPITVVVINKNKATGEEISRDVIGDDLRDPKNVFSIGSQANYVPVNIAGYSYPGASPIAFTPDKDRYELIVEYDKVNTDPVITAFDKSFDPGAVIDKAALLKGVTAKSFDGKDITSSVTVTPESINSSTPGSYDVFYTAKDSAGHTATKKVQVHVGINWPEKEVGGGWLVKDFTYSDNRDGTATATVTGFSASGTEKFKSNNAVSMPTHNMNGRVVTGIGYYAFQNKITGGSVASWGNVTSIDSSAFANNQLTKLPDSWGNVKSIDSSAFSSNKLTTLSDSWGNATSIGQYAFSNNQLTKLPDSWGNITSIDGSAFSSNQLTTLPDSWGNVKSISYYAFFNNQLTAIPDSWGNVKSIGSNAFRDNQLTTLPDSWGNVTSIDESAFFNNDLTTIPDSWGNVESIGNSAFQNSQLTTLPDSWGNITTIGNSAFQNNKLTTLPDSWGNITSIGGSSFSDNQLITIPDSWGNITSIGSGAFSSNQLTTIPDSWGNVKSISGYAFSSNKLTTLPDSWGNITIIGDSSFKDNKLTAITTPWGDITTIGNYAFSSNQLTELPDSWGNVTYIGYNAFDNNKLTTIPDSWGNVESIGSNSFFNNQLTTIPDSWGNVKSIDSYAFRSNKLTKIPDSWGNITSIGGSSFKDNKLTTLPDSWGNVKSIGSDAFQYNQLTTLPDSWGNIERIDPDAFSNNKLTAIPDSWGKITSIGDSAFRNNKLITLPDSWGNITNIGYGAFASNDLTTLPDSWGNVKRIDSGAFSNNNIPKLSGVYTVNSNNLTQSFINQLINSGLFLTNDNRVFLITNDRTNPNNVDGQGYFLINPTEVSVRYLDDNGKELLPTLNTYKEGTSYTAQPEPIYGYKAPEAKTVTLDGNKQTITFVYTKMTQAEIDAAKNSNMSLVTKHTDYLIGDSMAGTIKIDRSGFSTTDVVNPTIRVDFSDKVFDSSVQVSNVGSIYPKDIKVYDNYFTFVYPGTIAPGTSVEIPYTVKFKKYATPENTQFTAQATMFLGTTPVAQSNKDYYIGHYNKPYMNITANGSDYRGYVGDYDQTVVSNENPPVSHVSTTGKNSITYNLSVYGLDRNVSKYTITTQLPQYSVHPASGVKRDSQGKAYAVFDPELNPGWVLGADGVTLTFTGDNNGNPGSISKRLVLKFPGAEESRIIPLSGSSVLTPTNKPDTEGLMNVSSSISNYFYKWVPPKGELFVKQAAGPQDYNGTVFYDNTKSRSEEFGWRLVFNAETTQFTNMVMTDNGLDPRMYYSRFIVPSSMGAAVVTAYDSSGATIFSQDADGTKDTTVTLPDNIAKNATSVSFRAKNVISRGTYGSVMVYTKLKDPSVSHYDSTPNSSKNTFHNNLDFSSDEAKGGWGADKVIRARDQVFYATKTSSYTGDIITGNSGVYTIGFTPHMGYGEDITNFQEIDLLPKGLEVESYTMSNNFARIPGASVEFVNNYNNTGHDAVIWKAPLVPYTAVTPGNNFVVGTIGTYISSMVPNGNMVNDVFVKADGVTPSASTATTDNRLIDGGTWSKAQSASDITAASLMEQRKSIRTYDADDKPGSWLQGVTTTVGQKIDYRLRLTNGTDMPRDGVVLYDVLPRVGDLGLVNANEVHRESQFANVYDTSRSISVPAGLKVQYYNGAVPAYTLSNATDVLPGLAWSDTPTKDATAIRIIQDGSGYTLPARSSLEVIVPMLANQETGAYPQVPADKNVGKKAWNSFFYKDSIQTRLIEGNRVYNEMVKPPITVEFKKMGMTGALANAVFEYRRADGTVVKTVKSGADGMVRFENMDTREGDTIVETDAPFGYSVSNERRVLSSEVLSSYYANDNDGTLTMPDFHNLLPQLPLNPIYGSLEFTKIDADGAPLRGAVFRLTKTSTYNGVTTNYLYEAVSNDQGVVSFKNIPTGSGYTLTETTAPGKLAPTSVRNNITIKRDETTKPGTTVLGVDNAIVNDRANVPISKISVTLARTMNSDGSPRKFGTFDATDGSMLSNAKISIINADTGATVTTITSSSSSASMVNGLIPGVKYRLVETTAPTDYAAIENFTMEFKVNAKGQLTDVNGNVFPVQGALYVPNVPAKKVSSIQITKYSNEYASSDNPSRGQGIGSLLPGAQFVLEKQNDAGNFVEVPDSLKTTDANGKILWNNVSGGTYRYVEKTAPSGHIVSKYGVSQPFVVNDYVANAFAFNVTNPKLHMDVLKVERLATNFATQTAGDMYINTLPDRTNVVTIKNNAGGFDVVKTLPGATFELRTSPTGSTMETVTTDANGAAVIKSALDKDTLYYLVETAAPSGYIMKNDPIVIDPKAFANGHIRVVADNNKDYGRLVVSKINTATGLPITTDSAEFKVVKYREDAHGGIEFEGKKYVVDDKFAAKTLTTDTRSGTSTLSNLDFGVYSVVETRSPQGYLINETPRMFALTQESSSFTSVYSNDPELPEVSLVKKINGSDANDRATAVWLAHNAETMEVSFEIKNEGTTPLNNVRLSDVVTDGGDAEVIENMLKNADIEVFDNENSVLGTANGLFRNGEFTLIPGAGARLVLTVPAPAANTLHADTATVTGSYNGATATDDDPANAYKLPIPFPLPETGQTQLVMMGLGFLAMLVAAAGAMGAIARRREE